MLRASSHLLVPVVLASALSAQHSLIVSPDNTFVLRNTPANGAIGVIDDQEFLIVSPDSKNPYDARPFRTFGSCNIALGDHDGDSNLNETSMYGDLNCIFIRVHGSKPDAGPYSPPDIFYSITSDTRSVATNSGFVPVRDGDLFRVRHGVFERFITEAQVATALGDSQVDSDLDGMVQDAAGNLWFSPWLASGTYGTRVTADGDIYFISTNDIVYDSNDNVASITPNAAKLFASEADMDIIVANSGTNKQDGTPATRVGDLAGLSADLVNGQFWPSPQDPNLPPAPNFLFGSNFLENFDNIWTTFPGGVGGIAVINGVSMGYTGTESADGSRLGIGVVASGTQDAINAMAIIPQQSEWIAIDAPQSGGAQQGVFTLEVGRVQPSSTVALLFAFWAGDAPGGVVPGLALRPGIVLGGNRFLEAAPFFVDTVLTADANGYVTVSLTDTGTVPPGTELIVQGAGFAFGSGTVAVTGSQVMTF